MSKMRGEKRQRGRKELAAGCSEELRGPAGLPGTLFQAVIRGRAEESRVLPAAAQPSRKHLVSLSPLQ